MNAGFTLTKLVAIGELHKYMDYNCTEEMEVVNSTGDSLFIPYLWDAIRQIFIVVHIDEGEDLDGIIKEIKLEYDYKMGIHNCVFDEEQIYDLLSENLSQGKRLVICLHLENHILNPSEFIYPAPYHFQVKIQLEFFGEKRPWDAKVMWAIYDTDTRKEMFNNIEKYIKAQKYI